MERERGRGDSRDLAQLLEIRGKRDLGLLRAIEDTLSALDADCQDLAHMAQTWESLVEPVLNHPNHAELDRDGEVDSLFERLLEAIQGVNRRYREKHRYASAAEELQDEDGIADAYKNAIEASERLFEAVGLVRSAVREHDADASGCSEAYSNVEALLASLRR